ncbi:HD domain-containing phosphohydrolase [Sulfurimonas sp. HSL-1716]|uniref:HD domain-containing phosphohydrolase n=1 Tax=Hydrocurvibacter sulfurireducens TaxID=3131937 RepID=UPI0031F79892
MSEMTCEKIEHAHQEWMCALDSFKDAIFMHDDDFRILRCNKAYQTYAGRPFKEIIGQKYFEVFPKSDAPIRSCQEGLENPGTRGSEEEIQVGDTTFRSFAYSLTNKNGEYLYSMHTLEDVTKYKKMEMSLRESEEKFRVIVESVSDWIWEVDKNGRYTYVGPQSRTLIGYEPDELLGRTPFEFMLSEEAQRLSLVFQDIVKKRSEMVALENTMIHKDGHAVTMETSGIPFFNEEGELLGYRGIDRDITERREAEISLNRANRALRTLSAGNLALVRATNEEELLQSVTDIIVEKGGYNLAMVCYAQNNDAKSIVPKAWSGLQKSYFWEGEPSWGDNENGQFPISKAIRESKTQICRDLGGKCSIKGWEEAVSSRGFSSNIALPLIDKEGSFGTLTIYSTEAEPFDDDEVKLLEELASDLAYGIITLRVRIEHERQALLLRESLEQSIQTIAATLEARDPYTAGHQRRVSELAVAIASEMGLSEDQIKGISFAAMIHDLGKIHVPAEILSKPTRLNELEYKLIQMHPQTGYDILKEIKFPWPIADIILQHHEKIDGTGYPQGLKGDEILIESKIVALADVVEAMSSHRPYRPSLGIEAALDEIKRGKGSLYDSAAVDTCLKLFYEKKFAFSSDF